MSFGGGKGKEATWKQFVFSGFSGMVASAATHPLDLIKVRMQINQNKGKVDGIVATGQKVLQSEGVQGLYKGLSASLLRQATYTTARIGFYLQVKEWIAPKDRKGAAPPLWEKLVAGMSAGAIGAFVGSPADIVMVRMQADGKLPPEQRIGYKGAFDGLARITREEGVTALWKGSGPNMIRAMLMNTAQVASYDQSKQMLLGSGFFKDNIITHFTASIMAAFIACVVCNPIDVVKTRIMNSKKGSSAEAYVNSLDCFTKTLKNEGPLALYKGFWPFFTRLGPHTIITFVVYEQLSNISAKLKI